MINAEKRFRRARPGSVLILVVALLVLMALIGTAFITTTGTDRASASQNMQNTQIDLLVEGVRQMGIVQVEQDITPADPPGSGKLTFRPALVSQPGIAYPEPQVYKTYPLQYTDVDYAAWDAFLASRIPDQNNEGSLTSIWRYITASPLAVSRGHSSTPGNTDQNILPGQYASPYVSGNFVAKASSRYALGPGSAIITYAGGIQKAFPALGASSVTNDPDMPFGKFILAADCDGDGIADAALFELNVPQINGVKYYGALRIVDNAAAINPTIAWQPTPAGDAILPVNVFPTNIDLASLVNATDGAGALANYNYWRGGDVATPVLTVAYNDKGANARYRHATVYDAVWQGLGARPDNPGYNGINNRFRALGKGESATLASRGGILTNPLGTSSTLEIYFPNGMGRNGGAIGNAVNRQPYSPDQHLAWFNGIFDYENLAPNATPLRPLLSPHNGVTQYVPGFVGDSVEGGGSPAEQERQRAGKYRFRGNYPPASGTTYFVGDWVRYGAGASARAYVCVADHASGIAPTGATGAGLYWAEAPWYNHPVKVNLNTASFGVMKAAFYGVMGDGPEIRPSTTADAGYGDSAKIWTFGNPLRTAGTGGERKLSPRQVKQLRAALASVNAIDLRDQDDDVTSRTVILDDSTTGAAQTTLRVYGAERQPYITSVTANISFDEKPWVMIELYNPYPVALSLSAFRLAYQDKVTGLWTQLGPKLTGKTIAANGYYYFEGNKANRPKDIDDTASIKTTLDSNTLTLQIPELENLLKADGGGRKELYLLRTRQYDGAELTNTNVENPFNETNLGELVPADQLDFTGIQIGLNRIPKADDPTMFIPINDRFHYRRATKDDGVNCNRWHCVYGGPYNRDMAGGDLRPVRGWIRDERPNSLEPKVLKVTLPGLGLKSITAVEPQPNTPTGGSGALNPSLSTYRTRTLQVANVGAAGPYAMSTVANASLYRRQTTPIFPLGGFARVGDILAVPFTGGYRSEQAGFVDLQSISQDSAFAEDGDQTDDDEGGGNGAGAPVEQLGRFCPIVFNNINDLDTLRPRPDVALASHRYAWATDLFDYFTVTSPQDDYSPNVDPGGFGNPVTLSGDPTITSFQTFPKYPQQAVGFKTSASSPARIESIPLPVPNGPTITNPDDAKHDGREDGETVHGLINLNTAHWKVMAALPFTDDPARNIAIAKMIYRYREVAGNGPGPLRNLFDLNRVFDPAAPAKKFSDGMGWLPALNTLNPNLAQGDMSPLPAGLQSGLDGDDHVFGDFEARYLMINRISNMVTFRSDSFTVYALVQGWRNAGTDQPELVAQRRVASIVDRSTVRPVINATSTGQTFTPSSTVNVPQN